jgi:uronate dehydrogenase
MKAVQTPAAPLVMTGAAGAVASLIRPELAESYTLRLTDRARVDILRANESFVRADLRNLRAMRGVLRGARGLVHLGGVSKEAAFETILESNVRALQTVLEAARLEGVRRVVFASTGHVTGFYPRSEPVNEFAPVRPDTMYAVSKAFGESLCRYYADKFGLEIVCIRIGRVSLQPEYEVDRHIWMSPRDLVQLLRIAIEREPLHYEVVYGVSDNPQRWWSLDRAFALGFAPADSASVAASPTRPAEIDEVGEMMQGESFAANGFKGSLAKILGAAGRVSQLR